MNNCK